MEDRGMLPSRDALLLVWSVTKAVLAWPQLVMDAFFTFVKPLVSASVFVQRTTAPQNSAPTLQGRETCRNYTKMNSFYEVKVLLNA